MNEEEAAKHLVEKVRLEKRGCEQGWEDGWNACWDFIVLLQTNKVSTRQVKEMLHRGTFEEFLSKGGCGKNEEGSQ